MQAKHRFIIIIACLSISCLSAVKIGYAFSGGGARGFAHIGVLKVLDEYGIQPDYISGTSIGALIGALYSIGYTPDQIESIALSINWADLFDETYSRRNIYVGQKRWAPYGNVHFELDERWRLRFPTSIYSGNNLNLELSRYFSGVAGIDNFDEFPIPFRCIATNTESGVKRVFDNGSLMQAVRASLTVPSLIKPFEIDDSLYIDGGISDNLPISEVKSLGANHVLAFKTNSSLKTRNQLTDLISILDQTINIGMINSISSSIYDDVLVLEPNLDSFGARSFDRIEEIIQAGESYARENILRIVAYLDYSLQNEDKVSNSYVYTSDAEFDITKISILGNVATSDSKILEYLQLSNNQSYTIDYIIQRCRFTWNSQNFHYIYPVLRPVLNRFELDIHVQEKQEKDLAINLTYSLENNLSAGLVLRMNNWFLKNSSIISELKLGGENELNIDYVKNFGDFWGIYYRVFPYVNEKTTYLYNSDNFKISSVRLLEYGATSGIGLFSGKYLTLESFIYSYQSKLYRDITDTAPINRNYTISGIGMKAYHESLDDYIFPMNGLRMLFKTNFSRDYTFSDYIYSKFTGEIDYSHKISNKLSLNSQLKYGSYFDENGATSIDPYYFGGVDGFYGYDKYEISAPFYKIFKLGITYNPIQSTYIESGIQALSYGNYDDWTLSNDLEYNAYLQLGYKSMFGPVKLLLSFPFNEEFRAYLNIGYCNDIFQFSRR